MTRRNGKRARRPKQQSTQSVVVRGPGMYMPDKLVCQMDYSDINNQNAGGTVANDHLHNLNSVFDPDRTGVGHQPLGYDQMSAFYGKYRVLSVTARVTFMNGQATYGAFGGLVASNNTTAFTHGCDIAEQPFRSKLALLNRQGGIDVDVVSLHVNLWELLGRSKAQYQSDDVTGSAIGTSPTELLVLHTVTQSTDVTTAIAFTRLTELRYEVEWYDRVQLPQS